ncbi:MAG: hypothetical protein KZQ99_22335 [Candidatus Thiodiazotropha sp. (ex Dulcina madagascariensis)]|nr:hypothetical protein [Candidatus Thiodiazotropha sp. (ex Dulcina madagascariensis)]
MLTDSDPRPVTEAADSTPPPPQPGAALARLEPLGRGRRCKRRDGRSEGD